MQNNMIPLTVANTLDQTTKQRIEAKPNQTLKQAVQAQQLAPEGAFDVYDQLGKVISETSVANHRDATRACATLSRMVDLARANETL